MIASNNPTPGLQTALDTWCDDGGKWLDDADRMLSETQRFLSNLEDREEMLNAREASLTRWHSSLENREQLLLERERLLTEGLLDFESSQRNPSNAALADITRELNELRNSLTQANSTNTRETSGGRHRRR
ncbi:MAG: hypothetical protein U0905_06895 [Pirellulales bacterium]